MATPAEPDPPNQPPDIGTILEERYRLESQLGEGGVGWVFRARHLKLGHEVALKMLQERYTESSTMRPRFIREAKALAALKHPHIVTITDFSFWEERPYIVMELLEGSSLRQVIRDGPMEPELARTILARVLDALAYAHERGFVHRDLKPDNIFLLSLESDGAFPKLLDFGFVKLVGHEHKRGDTLSRSGIAFGTPAYMSPEQATGADADPRADLYSLGVVFYEMLTGRRPFDGKLPEVVRKHLTLPVPTFEERGCNLRESPALRELILKAMSKDPGGRWDSAAEMRAAVDALPSPLLTELAPSEPRQTKTSEAPTVAAIPSSRRMKTQGGAKSSLLRWIAVVALLAGAGVGTWLYLGWKVPEPIVVENVPEAEREPPVEQVKQFEVEPPSPPPVEQLPVEAEVEDDAPENPFEGEDPVEPDESADDPGEAEQATPEPDRPTYRNPWSRRSGRLLIDCRRRVLANRDLSGRTENMLKRYVRTNREDPRPHLLIAQSYMNRGWHRSSLERYDLALRVSEEAQADPRMLRDLVRMAADSSVADQAAESVKRLYGNQALEAIDREQTRHDEGTLQHQRLVALRQAIQG